MIRPIDDVRAYAGFLRAVCSDVRFCGPRLAESDRPEEILARDSEKENCRALGVFRSGVPTGLFVFLTLPEEDYLELLGFASADSDAYEEFLGELERSCPWTHADFVLRPSNGLFRERLEARRAVFQPEQQEMVLNDPSRAERVETDGIERLTDALTDPYLSAHSRDLYWTGERVIAAKDRFRTFVAVENGKLAGYLDLRIGSKENDPTELLVLPEYRRKGYGRKLLAAAVREGGVPVRLEVDADNLPAIRLYESLGFETDPGRNTVTAGWDIPRMTGLDTLQPSQFFLSEEKLAYVESWFRPDDLSGFDPIPVKMLDGMPVMTDGHTRAAAAVRAGLTSVPTVSERDDLNWDLYRTCVSECLRRGVRSPSDLTGRILSREDYRLKWDRWCDLIREEPLRLELRDEEWPYLGTDHDRVIVRAILVDDRGFFHFVRADRDDDFGKAVLIETSGGGVEAGEDLHKAVLRELREELGAEAEIVCELGTVSDYYNLIFRHNINHYFLCRAVSFGKNDLTEDERDRFHLSPLCLSFEDAVREYETRACTKLGRLIANRELPVLRRAEEFVR